MFCHLAERLARAPATGVAEVAFAFDADEHTGRFQGMRGCLRELGSRLAGGAIGYPGNDRLLVGSRGFFRVSVQIHGIAAHTGSSTQAGANAVVKAARLVERLESSPILD